MKHGKGGKPSSVVRDGALELASGPDSSGHPDHRGNGASVPDIKGGPGDLSATIKDGKANTGAR